MTLYRTFDPTEFRLLREGEEGIKGVLRSAAQRKGTSEAGGFIEYMRHPLDIPKPPSSYVSLTTMPHVAQDYAGVLVKVTVPKSALLKSWRVSNAEYLVRGSTPVLSAEVVAGAMPSAGATARWATEIGGVIGVGGVGAGYGVSWVGEKIIMAPDDSEPTK